MSSVGQVPGRRFLGIEVSSEVHTKYYNWIALGRFPNRPINDWLWRSQEVAISSDERAALSWLLNLRPVDDIWLRQAQPSPNFGLVFIGCRDRVAEVVSRRGLQQLLKKWAHGHVERNPSCVQEGQRLSEVFKFKRTHRIGHGLMRGESRPRDRYKNTREMKLAKGRARD